MARVWITGFEDASLDGWVLSGTPTAGSTSGLDMGGSYCLSIAAVSNYARKNLPSAYTTLYFAFKWRGGGAYFITFYDSAGTLSACVVRNTTSQKMEIRRGNNSTGTILDTGDTIFQSNKTYLIEIKYVPDTTTGVFTVKVNGVEECNDTGGNTTNGLEDVQGFLFGRAPAGASNSAVCSIDDIAIDDADWIGNTRVGIAQPEGTGSHTEWDPSTGANWDCVDEIPPVATDYVSTNVTNEIDSYAMTTIAELTASSVVKCVQVQGWALYEGAPTPTHIQLGARSGTTDDYATNISPGLTAAVYYRMMETKPGGGAWDKDSVDGMECGVKATA